MAAGAKVTDAGLAWAADRIFQNTELPMLYVGVGIGTNTPVDGDEALQTEVARILATPSRTGSTVTYTATFPPGSFGGSYNLYEIALFTAASGGTMYGREVWADYTHVWSSIGATFVVEVPVGR